MRLFISINLSEEMKESLMDIQDTMRTYGVRGKETVPENMHLTLAFIGEYDDPGYVKNIIESIEIRPFEITLKDIGAFRDLWWVGIDQSAPLQADIPFDRKKFSPHITIIRRADGRLSDVPEEEIAAHFGVSMRVDHISLMRSDRGKRGMIYTEL